MSDQIPQANQATQTAQTTRTNQATQTPGKAGTTDIQATLQGLTLRPVLATEDDTDLRLAIHGDFPRHKYEKIVIEGITVKMSNEEIISHPLIRLLHDYKHLMLHGYRGDGSTRAAKRKSRKPFENHFCRLSFIYTLSQDPETLDLTIKFVVDTAFRPIWTEYNGSRNRDMTNEDIAQAVANFIESYIAEAEQLIQSETASCHISSVISIVETAAPEAENPSKTTTPPQKTN